jgi:hypothetical protein
VAMIAIANRMRVLHAVHARLQFKERKWVRTRQQLVKIMSTLVPRSPDPHLTPLMEKDDLCSLSRTQYGDRP